MSRLVATNDTYSTISGAEGIQLGLSVVLKHLLGHMSSSNQTLHCTDSNVPYLLVLLLKKQDNSGSLGVERARDVEHGVLNDALNGIIGYGALGLQTVVRPTSLDDLQESGRRRVLEFNSSGAHCGGFVIRYCRDIDQIN